tara:strand:+ start:2396 stop:4108 length:1713 start_codon:yes stop_codon:yes gene_type:complete
MAFFEMLGVISIMPFIAVLTKPELIHTTDYLISLYKFSNYFGIYGEDEFLYLLGVMVFILLITSLLFKALTHYAKERFVEMRIYSICKRFMEGYMNQPFSWFLNRNSADLEKSILSEVATAVLGNLGPLIELTSKTFVAIALIILLLLNDTKLTITIFVLFFLFYGSIYLYSRKYLGIIGEERLNANKSRFSSVSEAFGGIKEIKLGGFEKFYTNRFARSAKIFSERQISARLLKILPRYFLESIAFGGVLLIILILMSQKGSFQNALPYIAVYIFAGYRLLPAFQSIYGSINELRFAGPSLDNLYNDYKELNFLISNKNKNVLPLNKNILLKNVNFSYPKSSNSALSDINLNIPVKNCVGIIGKTGSGKTTLIDIILGLLEPQKGTIEIDGMKINKQNLRLWQNNIGYVPQNIYLADDTIEANIALGINSENINKNAVKRSAENANIHNFIINELPKKYETTVGERGVRLSGGQRQRIGIARALYHKPQVLVLDEATSSLDNQTEKIVMDTINGLSKEITIVLIAHRLSTLKNCDTIYLLEKGKIKKKGSFESLVKSHENFFNPNKHDK